MKSGSNAQLRVALIHDYLTQFGGAEQVLGVLQRLFPEAPTFTTLHDPSVSLPGVNRARVHESELGRVAWFRRHHRAAMPLFPAAMRDLRRHLTEYDVLIADSSAWAHQLKPHAGQAMIVYCHSPARFLYGDADYLSATGVTGLPAQAMQAALGPFRWLDRRAYRRAKIVLANSKVVAERLATRLGIHATVLHPPVDVDRYAPLEPVRVEDWYLVVSRLVPHKRVDLVVETATKYDLPVKIVGLGRDMDRLKAMAGPTVEFLGFLPDDEVIDHFRRCRAFILPGVEDFGISAVEAQAAGRPVIAINRGGACETVVDGKTGVLFDEQCPEALHAAINHLNSIPISTEACVANARLFDESAFREGMLKAVEIARARG